MRISAVKTIMKSNLYNVESYDSPSGALMTVITLHFLFQEDFYWMKGVQDESSLVLASINIKNNIQLIKFFFY